MKRILAFVLAAMVLLALSPTVCASFEYTLRVTSDASYSEGNDIMLRISLDDIQVTGGITFVSFDLHYDASVVTPVVKNDPASDNEAMMSFLTAPDGWEGVCSVDEVRGIYKLSYMTAEKEHAAKNNGDVIINIPFVAKMSSSAVSTRFYISDSCCASYEMNVYDDGIEGSCTLWKKAAQTAPKAPTLKAVSLTSVELNPVEGAQYRCVGEGFDSYWRDSPLFTGLTSYKTYSFYIRIKATEQYAPSGSSPALTVTLSLVSLELKENSSYTMNEAETYLFVSSEHETAADVATQFTVSGAVVLDASGKRVTGAVGTGMTAALLGQDGVIVDSVTIIVKGDVNGDGNIDVIDYATVKRAVIGIISIDGAFLEAGALAGDYDLSVIDYAMLKRHVLGIYDIYQ